MKLSNVLLASMVECGRDWSLLNKYKLMRTNDFTTGGLLQPRRLEEDTTNIREQSRVFPFCSAGTPADDNCYRKCDPDAGCESELVFYTTVQDDIAKCRKKTAKRINKADACIKLANNNPLISGQIDYNGEKDGFHVHKTVEIRAPFGHYVDVTVGDFSIGNKTLSVPGKDQEDEKCGYGSIFIFAGQGTINQMYKVIEFCGSSGNAIVDYTNDNYDGEAIEIANGNTHTITSNRVIMAIMTQENFSTDTVGSANAEISWNIVAAPEGELLRGIDYLTNKLVMKWRAGACVEFSEFSLGGDTDGTGECAWKSVDANSRQERRQNKFKRYYFRIAQIIQKIYTKSYLKCYKEKQGGAYRLPQNHEIIQSYNQIQSAFVKTGNNAVSVHDVTVQLIQHLLTECKLSVFWEKKMEDAALTFNKLLGISNE